MIEFPLTWIVIVKVNKNICPNKTEREPKHTEKKFHWIEVEWTKEKVKFNIKHRKCEVKS